MKFINVPVFIVSLCIGIFLSYISLPRPQVVFVYPTPENANQIQYRDEVGACFRFSSHPVKCPSDTKQIREYPIQTLREENKY